MEILFGKKIVKHEHSIKFLVFIANMFMVFVGTLYNASITLIGSANDALWCNLTMEGCAFYII
jgi:hypothetical protein